MEQKSNVVKLNNPNQRVSDDLLLAQNLAQVILEVVRQHGAKTTMQAVQGMVQDAQTQVKLEKQFKAVSNG